MKQHVQWEWYFFVFLLFALGNAADYFYQADMHGWFNPLWENGYRVPEYELWLISWIPRDPWHWAQMLNNTCDKLAAGIVVWRIVRTYRGRWVLPLGLGVVFGFYLLSRGLTFGLLLRIWG